MLERELLNRTAVGAIAAISMLGSAQQALAQAGPDHRGTDSEIIVTAQRRAQSIQEVPLAVSAFDDDRLDDLQIANAGDLQRVVPNFSYTPTNFGGVNYTIRGIGASVLGDGADTGVALHYNGVFLQGGGNTSLYYDVEAVEVLRGPQGTLFGRNATGGVVNLRTHRPSDDYEGEVKLRFGERKEFTAEAVLNLPLSDRVAFRFAGLRAYYDGDTRNLTTGNRIDGDDAISARGSLRIRLGERTTIDASATYLLAKGDTMQANKRLCARDPEGALGCLPDRLGFGQANYLSTLGGLLAEEIGLAPRTDPFAGSLNPADLRQVAIDFDPRVRSESWITSLEIAHEFGPLTLTSLSSFASEAGFYEADSDFAVASGSFRRSRFFPGGMIPVSAPDPENLGSLAGRTLGAFDRPWSFERGDSRGKQWVSELRLASSYKSGFDFLLGGFFIDSRRRENLYNIGTEFDAVGQLLEAAPPFVRLETPRNDLRSFAIFGETYWKLADDLNLTLGARWTHDRKYQKNRSLLLDLPKAFDEKRLTDRAVTGRIVLDWAPETSFARDTLVYASLSRGYKGGGFNPQGVVLVPPRFDPEYVNAVEIGTKNSFSGGGTVNGALFFYDYNGLQVSKIVNRTSVNENIDARIWGAELEAAIPVTEGVQFDFTLSHLSTHIGGTQSVDPRDPAGGLAGYVNVKDTATGGNCVATLAQLDSLLGGIPFGDCAGLGLSSGNPASLRGNRLPNAPAWSFRIGGEWKQPVSSALEVRVRADYSWRSDFWGRIFNRDPVDRIESWGVLNAMVEIAHPDGKWFLRGEASNLLDSTAVTGLFVTDATSGLATNLFLLPRRRFSIVAGARF